MRLQCVIQRDRIKRITLEGPEPPWLQGPLKAAFLGATGVGKTSLLQQFFKHDFSVCHIATGRRNTYKSCVVCDTSIRELIVFDIPTPKRFPTDSIMEFNNGYLGLRNVHAYVLVFDMGNLDTFQYCRSMRDQILESFSHRDFSIMVVGNKFDLIAETNPHTQELKDISTLVRKHWRCGYELKDISTLVRKHWRCGYVECSAKFNYKVGDVFRELMGCTVTGGSIGNDYIQSSRGRSKCNIL
uniref:Putative ras-related gtpase n=1 Tax=Lutzomyia longipalpis TaxID=7200 RepID=A0A1B0CFJ2_LUTLO